MITRLHPFALYFTDASFLHSYRPVLTTLKYCHIYLAATGSVIVVLTHLDVYLYIERPIEELH